MAESVTFEAHRTVAVKGRKHLKAEDLKAEAQEAVAHIGRRLAEEEIDPGQAGHTVAAVKLPVDSLEEDCPEEDSPEENSPEGNSPEENSPEENSPGEDNPVVVADHNRLAVVDSLVQGVGPEVEVGQSPVVVGMESDFAADIARGTLPDSLAAKSLYCSQHKDDNFRASDVVQDWEGPPYGGG